MQNTSRLLMIEPVGFGYNEQTADTNVFQSNHGYPVQEAALNEFRDFVDLLRKNRLHVTVIPDTAKPVTPDAVFPNNWISFHDEGIAVIYPMLAVNRRNERKPGILAQLKEQYRIKNVIDISYWEKQGIFLEGTGSLVLDRVHKLAYASLSERTHPKAIDDFCHLLGYEKVVFNSVDYSGKPIYHTNVVMTIASDYAVLCLDAVANEHEKALLVSTLTRTGKDIIEISMEQLNSFAGNMLQVINMDGERLLIMSTQAYDSLSSIQLLRLEKYNRILHAPLYTIEKTGGGSARCMIAEIFVPVRGDIA